MCSAGKMEGEIIVTEEQRKYYITYMLHFNDWKSGIQISNGQHELPR